MERKREAISGQVTLDYLARMAAEGWTLAAVEWVRPGPGDHLESWDTPAAASWEEVPYALRISESGDHLEPNPLERTVLLLILEKITREKRITEIARELNAEGYRTRQGKPWTPPAVFELLPRLIEAGPGLLKSKEWIEQREHPRPAN